MKPFVRGGDGSPGASLKRRGSRSPLHLFVGSPACRSPRPGFRPPAPSAPGPPSSLPFTPSGSYSMHCLLVPVYSGSVTRFFSIPVLHPLSHSIRLQGSVSRSVPPVIFLRIIHFIFHASTSTIHFISPPFTPCTSYSLPPLHAFHTPCFHPNHADHTPCPHMVYFIEHSLTFAQ